MATDRVINTSVYYKVELSDNIKQNMANKLEHLSNSNALTFADASPSKIQLGMNNVPVLNQGPDGTCATFAVTAALDAALGKGDYISQLCLLQLGGFLEKNSNIPSGWDGSRNLYILNEISLFGVVDKTKQRTYGCGGLTEYPNSVASASSNEISPYEYHQINTSLENMVGWSPVIDDFTRKEKPSAKTIINSIKTVLNTNDRLTVGVILADLNLGNVGAVGTYRAGSDTWILTPEIIKDIQSFLNGTNPGFQFGGHALVITGYDDDAVAKDNSGATHKGLFTLRNSWGNGAGDKGEFYMSYDYFSVLAAEAQRITKKG